MDKTYTNADMEVAKEHFLLLPTSRAFQRWAETYGLTPKDVSALFEVSLPTARQWLTEDGFDAALGPAKILMMVLEHNSGIRRILEARADLLEQISRRDYR